MRRVLITSLFAASLLGGLALFRDAGTALMAAGLIGSAAALQPESSRR